MLSAVADCLNDLEQSVATCSRTIAALQPPVVTNTHHEPRSTLAVPPTHPSQPFGHFVSQPEPALVPLSFASKELFAEDASSKAAVKSSRRQPSNEQHDPVFQHACLRLHDTPGIVDCTQLHPRTKPGPLQHTTIRARRPQTELNEPGNPTNPQQQDAMQFEQSGNAPDASQRGCETAQKIQEIPASQRRSTRSVVCQPEAKSITACAQGQSTISLHLVQKQMHRGIDKNRVVGVEPTHAAVRGKPSEHMQLKLSSKLTDSTTAVRQASLHGQTMQGAPPLLLYITLLLFKD